MLFVTAQDSVALRAVTHGLAIEFASHCERSIGCVAMGGVQPESFIESLTKNLRYQNSTGLDWLVRDRLRTHEDNLYRRFSTSQVRMYIAKLASQGKDRGESILQHIVPPLMFSMLPENRRSFDRFDGHESIELMAWHDGGDLSPDRAAIQFFETVGLILGRPEPVIDCLFCEGRMKQAIVRGWTHRITLDNGRSKEFANVIEFIDWLE